MVRLTPLINLFLFRLHKSCKDPLEVAHDFLTFTCTDPLNNNICLTVIATVFRICVVLLGFLSGINLFYSNDIFEFASTIEGFMITLQSINDQVLCLVLYRKEILHILHLCEKFWDPLELDPEDKSGSQKKISEFIKALNIFGATMIGLGIIYTICCICLSMPPIQFWLPQRYMFLQTVVLVIDGIWFAYSCISVFAFNALFIAISVNMCVQYRLISYRLQNVTMFTKDTEEIRTEIKILIEHHIFVMEFSQIVRNTFSLHFLVRIVETVGMLCVALYIASDRASSLYQIARSCQLACALLVQFTLDCYVSHDVILESLEIGDAAYNSEWYSSPVLASYVKMIIIRATKPVAFTAGGIVNVNKQTMTSVLKTTFSYLTALKALDAE